MKEKTKKKDETCPNCGYCPHCGRSRQAMPYYYPVYPWWQQPSYPYFTWVYCDNNQTGTIASGANTITTGNVTGALTTTEAYFNA